MLSLTHAQFSDAGLEKLTGLTRLRELDLFSAICITDVGMRSVGKLTALQVLDVSHTPVTDLGLKYLTGLADLRHLHVWSTRVTAEGARRLHRALPKCEIEFELNPSWHATSGTSGDTNQY